MSKLDNELKGVKLERSCLIKIWSIQVEEISDIRVASFINDSRPYADSKKSIYRRKITYIQIKISQQYHGSRDKSISKSLKKQSILGLS